jgi:hypothetical protein
MSNFEVFNLLQSIISMFVCAIVFYIVWCLYKIIAGPWCGQHKTQLGRLNAMLKNLPYPVVFRTKDCKTYSKYNCHIAIDEKTGSEILVIDLIDSNSKMICE